MRKIIPGFRFFFCEDCDLFWYEKCRDCHSPSNSSCEKCYTPIEPDEYKEHPEWKVDVGGNLIEDEIQ
jgi:hypothetical protein